MYIIRIQCKPQNVNNYLVYGTFRLTLFNESTAKQKKAPSKEVGHHFSYFLGGHTIESFSFVLALIHALTLTTHHGFAFETDGVFLSFCLILNILYIGILAFEIQTLPSCVQHCFQCFIGTMLQTMKKTANNTQSSLTERSVAEMSPLCFHFQKGLRLTNDTHSHT